MRDGQERLLDDVVERVRFDIGDDSRDLPLPGNTSAGSCSCRHPPRGTKTSGLSSRLSRTPARTLPPARTLLPPVSASASPGRPTQSLPPPDVDSLATPAAFLRDFARPPRACHLAPQCQEVTASTAARRSTPLVQPCRGPSSREGTVSSGSSRISTGDGHVSGECGMCAPTKRPKLDLSARTHYRGALLERWLAQFWNESRV